MRFIVMVLVLMLFSACARADTAIFAGGNYWNTQAVFDRAPGITNTVAGETAGRQAVMVTYNPAVISYQQLLNIFWRNIDPVDDAGQFCDRGAQYTTGIFYTDETQKTLALDSKMLIEADSERMGDHHVVTIIGPASAFAAAAPSSQVYYLKNPLRFNFYTSRCGRNQRLTAFWGR